MVFIVKKEELNLSFFVCRLLKSQSKVKELTRESRNREEEMEEYRRKLDSVKNERRRAEKNVQEVITNTLVVLWVLGSTDTYVVLMYTGLLQINM